MHPTADTRDAISSQRCGAARDARRTVRRATAQRRRHVVRYLADADAASAGPVEQHYRVAAWFATPPLPDAAGFSMPCIPIQRTKASNQPVLVVSFGYIPKPWPPCS